MVCLTTGSITKSHTTSLNFFQSLRKTFEKQMSMLINWLIFLENIMFFLAWIQCYFILVTDNHFILIFRAYHLVLPCEPNHWKTVGFWWRHFLFLFVCPLKDCCDWQGKWIQIYRTDVTESFDWKRENGTWKKYSTEFHRPRPFLFTCLVEPLIHDWTYDVEDECFCCQLGFWFSFLNF